MQSNRLSAIVWLTWIAILTQGYGVNTTNQTEPESSGNTLTRGNPVRKCCSEREFYSVITHSCETDLNWLQFFPKSVRELLGSVTDDDERSGLAILPGRIATCPETLRPPNTDVVASNATYELLSDGIVRDLVHDRRYDKSHYCLELAGDRIQAASLVLAYCPAPQSVVPKCCPSGRYFDLSLNDCAAQHPSDEADRSVTSYIPEGQALTFQGELTCADIPIRISLNETEFMDNNLCVDNIDECYRADKYCVDSVQLSEDEASAEPSAYVCPDLFVNKCCPDGSSLHVSGCVSSDGQSPALGRVLQTYRYQIKGVSERGTKCSPFTIADDSRSDIKWRINPYGLAVIAKLDGEVVRTRNFCVDDFRENGELFPALKVCSEEVRLYHEVSDIDEWSGVVGKCCPLDKIFDAGITHANSHPECVLFANYSLDPTDMFGTNNVSNLVFSNFPRCEPGSKYHHYQLGERVAELVALNDDQSLTIREGCNKYGKTIRKSSFCLDLMAFSDDLKPVAIVCAPSENNFHLERNPIIAFLVATSCAALLVTLVVLILMRVRRGMITVKKVNTLAGKTLISYVFSQLVGYAVLCVLTLADFEQGTHTCLVLSSFLMFFITAAFFWNSSICLECLLLTLRVRLSGSRRFVLYNLWSWGVPLILTIFAIHQDIQGDGECGGITPKFGTERCFFSDPVAQILYFYLPITVTVIFNVMLLVASKIIRKNALKKLAKDPNRIRKQGTIKQVFARSFKRQLGSGQQLKSTHSGLRTHQQNNVWIESVKLIVWSGITWTMELLGALVSIYVGRPKGEWYHYLWYLPVACNCLRGIGIFVLIVITTDNKVQLVKNMRQAHSTFNSNVSRVFSTIRYPATRRYGGKTTKHKIQSAKGAPDKKRKESVSTVITVLSNWSETVDSDTVLHRDYVQSVSQYEQPMGLSCRPVPETAMDVTYPDTSSNSSIADKPLIDFNDMYYCTHL